MRIVTGRPALLEHRFAGAGREAAPVSGVTVTVTRDDGEQLVAAEPVEATGDVYRYTLEALDDVDRLRVEWHGVEDGRERRDVVFVDVAGGTYVELSAAAAIAAKADDALIAAIIVEVERRIDEATATAWVPRYARQTIRGPGGRLDRVPVRGVLWARDRDGVDVPLERLGHPSRLGVLERRRRDEELTVGYAYGADAPPADLALAAQRAVVEFAFERSTQRHHERAREVMAADTRVNFAAMADLSRGRVFGMPDVDAVVMAHAHTFPVLA